MIIQGYNQVIWNPVPRSQSLRHDPAGPAEQKTKMTCGKSLMKHFFGTITRLPFIIPLLLLTAAILLACEPASQAGPQGQPGSQRAQQGSDDTPASTPPPTDASRPAVSGPAPTSAPGPTYPPGPAKGGPAPTNTPQPTSAPEPTGSGPTPTTTPTPDPTYPPEPTKSGPTPVPRGTACFPGGRQPVYG